MNNIAIQILVPVVLGVAAAAIPYAVYLFSKWTAVNFTAQQAAVLNAAAVRAGNLVYAILARTGGSINDPAAVNVAVAAGAKYLQDTVPDAAAHFGKSADDLARMVEAQMGQPLAADPGVSVGGKPAPVIAAPVKAA